MVAEALKLTFIYKYLANAHETVNYKMPGCCLRSVLSVPVSVTHSRIENELWIPTSASHRSQLISQVGKDTALHVTHFTCSHRMRDEEIAKGHCHRVDAEARLACFSRRPTTSYLVFSSSSEDSTFLINFMTCFP